MVALAPRRVLLATSIALAVVAVGCGSNSGSQKSSFISQADAICAKGNAAVRVISAQIKQAQRGSNPDKVFRQLASLTREGDSTFLPYVDQLDALTPPPSDRDRLKGWIASQRRQLSLGDRLATALAAHDTAAVANVSEQIDVLGQSNNGFAKSYGMAECAKAN